jgi:hypothetical protein
MKHYSQLKSEFFRDLLVERPMLNLPAGGMLIFVSYFSSDGIRGKTGQRG